jgi:type III pantothenate kinase
LTKELVTRAKAEVLQREAATGKKKVRVVATGGLAELIAPLVPEIDEVEPNLALDGLALIWQRAH